MHRHGFTLIEMLLATALTAVLMGGVLMLLSGANRDAQLLRRQSQPGYDGLFALFEKDLANSTELSQSPDGRVLELSGNLGIDARSLRPDGRLARASYRVTAGGQLRREQTYLDSPGRPQPWGELAALDIDGVSVIATAADPARVRIVLSTPNGSIWREVRIR